MAETELFSKSLDRWWDDLDMGRMTFPMHCILQRLNRHAKRRNGIVAYTSAALLSEQCGGKHFITVDIADEALKRLEMQRHITRAIIRGSTERYSVEINNFPGCWPVKNEAGELTTESGTINMVEILTWKQVKALGAKKIRQEIGLRRALLLKKLELPMSLPMNLPMNPPMSLPMNQEGLNPGESEDYRENENSVTDELTDELADEPTDELTDINEIYGNETEETRRRERNIPTTTAEPAVAAITTDPASVEKKAKVRKPKGSEAPEHSVAYPGERTRPKGGPLPIPPSPPPNKITPAPELVERFYTWIDCRTPRKGDVERFEAMVSKPPGDLDLPQGLSMSWALLRDAIDHAQESSKFNSLRDRLNLQSGLNFVNSPVAFFLAPSLFYKILTSLKDAILAANKPEPEPSGGARNYGDFEEATARTFDLDE